MKYIIGFDGDIFTHDKFINKILIRGGWWNPLGNDRVKQGYLDVEKGCDTCHSEGHLITLTFLSLFIASVKTVIKTQLKLISI